jgi:hypothetical protein
MLTKYACRAICRCFFTITLFQSSSAIRSHQPQFLGRAWCVPYPF